MKRVTLLVVIGRGLVAGAAGTGAMTAAQELAAPPEAGEAASDGADPWGQAPAPAQAARRVLAAVFGRPVSPSRIESLTHATHWLYGIGWGVVYGLVQETAVARPLRHGLLFGAGVWGASYLQLVPMGIYKPPWRYPPRMLALDASYHLVYGSFVVGAYDTLERH
jgi:uncharacterized membrane protein YagU involved in acid resistance